MPIGRFRQTYRKTKESNIFVDQKSLDKTIKRLQRMGDEAKKDVREVMKKGARMVSKTAKSKAPKTDRYVHRYSGGDVVAVYWPGNLKRSIGILPLRRTDDIFVGPRVSKRSPSGRAIYKGGKVDGYYAHMIEKGALSMKKGPQPFMRPAFEQNKVPIIQMAKQEISALAKKYNR